MSSLIGCAVMRDAIPSLLIYENQKAAGYINYMAQQKKTTEQRIVEIGNRLGAFGVPYAGGGMALYGFVSTCLVAWYDYKIRKNNS